VEDPQYPLEPNTSIVTTQELIMTASFSEWMDQQLKMVKIKSIADATNVCLLLKHIQYECCSEHTHYT
jgi:hypothetical protein